MATWSLRPSSLAWPDRYIFTGCVIAEVIAFSISARKNIESGPVPIGLEVLNS